MSVTLWGYPIKLRLEIQPGVEMDVSDALISERFSDQVQIDVHKVLDHIMDARERG